LGDVFGARIVTQHMCDEAHDANPIRDDQRFEGTIEVTGESVRQCRIGLAGVDGTRNGHVTIRRA
jgi:hypothetical protein